MAIPVLTRREVSKLKAELRSNGAKGTPPGGRTDQWESPEQNFSPRDAILDSSLSVATDSLTGATTAQAVLLTPDPDNPGDLKEKTIASGATHTITVTNRSLDLSGQDGDYIIVVRIGREWRVIWIDC